MGPSIRHQRAKLNDIEIHYAAAGDPDAPLVVLLHGFPQFWYAWRALLLRLGQRFLAVAPDQRGYGLSEKPDSLEAYDLRVLIRDVLDLADHLGKERFSLVGHDWGGVVAWRMAMARPDRLDRMVIVNAPHPAIFARERRENPAQRAASGYIDLLVSPMAEAALAANGFIRLFDGLKTETGGTWLDAADREAYREAWSRPGALTGMVSWYRAAGLRSDGGGETSSDAIRTPTLVIWGERDRFLLPGNLDGLEERVEDLEVVRIPDAGHWVVHEEPERIGGLVESFLGGDR